MGKWAREATEGGGLWTSFDAFLQASPETDTLWWQLCTLNGSPRDGFESALVVLDVLRARIPELTIYVSAQPSYEPPGICDISGPSGPQFMAEVTTLMVSEVGLLAGPIVGPLTQAETIGGCHANESGQDLLGQQLLSFFGAS